MSRKNKEHKLDRIERTNLEREQYNETYHKHLSYGYYTAYLSHGWLEYEWLLYIKEKRRKEFEEEYERQMRKYHSKQVA